jgi:hypothetical protein
VEASLFVESSTGVLFPGDKHSASYDTESRVLNINEIRQSSKMTSQVSGRLSFHCTPFINCICLSEGLHGQFRVSKHGTNAFSCYRVDADVTMWTGLSWPVDRVNGERWEACATRLTRNQLKDAHSITCWPARTH